tara:strand:- start:18 stop:230 length:213 start_codon:yes stop_codon:yes gene_type:complete
MSENSQNYFYNAFNEDTKNILLMIIFVYFIENFKKQLDISMTNIFLFINLLGIYFFLKKIRININIDYNI